MTQYLFPYIKLCIEAEMNSLLRQLPQSETDYLRGHIMGLKEIADIEQRIKYRMQVESNSDYKNVIQLSMQKEPN